MSTKPHTIELLAPARNREIGIAAINCGADAVYIGAEHFSAREDAGNTLTDIEAVIQHAHHYYARVYVALNTILRDDELPEALELIKRLYDMGTDGIIIQDFGLLELPLPPIPLIASTQMNTDTKEKGRFLESIGFKRVILPRELSLQDIASIRAHTSVELECFVHGSLCVCYSGQCYLSYALGGRSANRGACGQPCRHTYSLVTEDGTVIAHHKHLLSLKDLNRSEHLESLIQAGISSLKIEGRLKDKAYVVNITSFYRKKLDHLMTTMSLKRSSSGTTTFDFTPDPYKTFNRGYTDYALTGTKEHMASLHTPKSFGEEIGTITHLMRDSFMLDRAHTLTSGDGICFLDSDAHLRGTHINKVVGNTVYPDKIHSLTIGTRIFRNLDRAFIKTLDRVPAKRKIALTMTLSETADGLILEVLDEDMNKGIGTIATAKTIAEKPDLAEQTMISQFSSLNETIFSCAHFTSTCKHHYFLPRALLNTLRRNAIDDIMSKRAENRPREKGTVALNTTPYPVSTITYLGNVLNSKAIDFFKRHGASVSELAAENGLDMHGKRVMKTNYCIKKELGLCGKDTGPLSLIDEKNRTYPLTFHCAQCKMEVYW